MPPHSHVPIPIG